MAISVGGLMSGLDTNGIIDQMLAVQQRPIQALQNSEAGYQVELSAYGNLKNVLGGLKTALNTLGTANDLTRYTAESSDTGLFSVTAEQGASTGDYNITVSQMADVHKLTSMAFSADEAVGEGTIHLGIGTAGAVDIEVSATDTIQDVARAINNTGTGIKATAIFDGTDYFLNLAGEETGEDNMIHLTVTEPDTDAGDSKNTDTTGLSRLVYDPGVTANMTNTQSAADAVISVDGVSNIRRSTNVIDDVIEGVTLTLESAPDEPDNSAALSVTRSTSAVTGAINEFVSKYNSAMEFITTQQNFNAATGQAGTLLGDATTNSIRNNLKSMISGTVSGVGDIEKLMDLGISFNGDGFLKVEADQLADALKQNVDDVVQFFSQTTDGSEGFAVKMSYALDNILNDSTGMLATRTNGIQATIENLQDRVETLEMRNAAWEERTRSQFNAMELLLAQYQTTGDYLSQQITGLQNFNSYVSNRG